MKVAVIGFGAIGGVVVGALRDKGIDVVVVGKPEQKQTIENDGFIVEGFKGRSLYYVDVKLRLEEKVDLVILTVKTQNLRDVVEMSREFLIGPLILSTQNGVRSDTLLKMMLGEENLISSIVMFGATYVPHNKVVHNFEGNWLIGRPFGPNDEKVKQVAEFLKQALDVVEVENISAMKWTKIFVNSSNCLPALVGKSMQETYANLDMCKLALRILKEGFEIVKTLGVELPNLPDFEIDKLKGLTQMGIDEAAPIFSSIMTNLSKEPLYGSILQSIQRGKLTEIDYINGELANQARLHNLSARLNTRVTELVHAVETKKTFLTFEEVLSEIEKTSKLEKEDFF
ncbi:MAG: 2-dehydropantoate 2-reductase [Candidatus Omnitrophota bacterium]